MNFRCKDFKILIFAGLMLPGAAWASGAVYAMTNQPGSNANQIKVWTRATNGQLTFLQTIDTQGGGSGVQLDGTDSLGSQGSVMLDPSHRFLFVVNTETGSDVSDCNTGTITSFAVNQSSGSLTFISRVSSGGLYPDSLAVAEGVLYVLNAGGPGELNACGIEPNLSGFIFDWRGNLAPLPFSTQSLNPGPMPGSSINPAGFLNCDPGGFPSSFVCGSNPPAFPRSPAEIQFSPDGRFLVVTIKGTNSILLFPMFGPLPTAPVIWKAQGPTQPTYFGFSFDAHGNLIVAEPFGTSATIPAKPASAVSSFSISRNGALTPITTDLANNQALACWVAIDPITGKYAYIGNNGSGTISSYLVDSHGTLTLLNATAGSGMTGPNDMATVKDGTNSYIYALAAGGGTVNGWTINHDGSLTSLGAPLLGMPAAGGAQGLAAY